MSSHDEWYPEALEDFNNRRDAALKFVETFNEEIAPKRHFTHVLSVGPGECFIECALLRTRLNQVKTVTLVEANEELAHKGRENIIRHFGQSYQVMLSTDVIQNYDHRGETYDLILLSHVIYHFFDDFEGVLEKMKSWLSPAGIIVIVFSDSKYNLVAAEVEGGMGDGYSGVLTKTDVERAVTNAGLSFERHAVSFTFDISDLDTDNAKWLSIIINRVPTEHEVIFMKEKIRQLAVGNVLPATHCVLVAHS